MAAIVAVEPAMLCYADFSESGRRERTRFRADVIEPANAAFRRGDDATAAALMTGGIQGRAAPAVDDPAYRRRMQNVLAMRMLALSSNEFPLLPPTALQALPMPVLLSFYSIRYSSFKNKYHACLPSPVKLFFR